jgi:ubiquinone/menaquinone biosynthesis C-methylase UbiE
VPYVHVRDAAGAEPEAIDGVADLRGKHVLEVGCGRGRLTAFAAVRAGFVYAFDPNPDAVAEAKASLQREALERVRFAVHDTDALDVERRRFDVALCGWSSDVRDRDPGRLVRPTGTTGARRD